VATLCFLSPPDGNYFMTELLAAIAGAAERRGAATQFGGDVFAGHDDDAVFVVIPHEFFALSPERDHARELARTIGLCVEQPGTYSFEVTCGLAPRLGAVVALHESACRELRRRGIAATHFPLGYVSEWDTWHGEAVQRPIDVAYLGSHDERRGQLLASYADILWPRTQRLVLARPEWHRGAGPSFVVGNAKHRLLRSSRVLLNLHREGAIGLEWLRVLEAICNGAVVISEHSRDCAPLVPGEHFVSGRTGDLALLADLLLDDEQRLCELRSAAYALIRETLPMERAIDQLLTVADAVRAAGESAAPRPDGVPAGDEAGTAASETAIAERLAAHVAEELRPLRAAIKGLTTEVARTRRALARLDQAPLVGDPLAPVAAGETEAYAAATPRVSVAIAVDNDAGEVIGALESVAASEHDSFEILIGDDASTDGSAALVAAYLAERPWLPARLHHHDAARGRGRTRNALAAQARGSLVLILDADHSVYPTALARLEQALAADPDASLAYALSVTFVDDEPTGLTSAHAWHPTWLRAGNYIDSTVLLRRDTLIALGGYCEDPRISGHEDYDLWCRLADAGQHGVHVPEMLGSHHERSHGTLESSTNREESLTGIDDAVCRSLILARAPRLFGPGLVADPYAASGSARGEWPAQLPTAS
jgi:GT2 family glycosyltransferase